MSIPLLQSRPVTCAATMTSTADQLELTDVVVSPSAHKSSNRQSGKFKALDEKMNNFSNQTTHIEVLLESQAKSLKHMVLLGMLVVAGCIAVTLGVVLTRDVHASENNNMVTSGGRALATRSAKDVLVVTPTSERRQLATDSSSEIEGVVVAEMSCTEVSRGIRDIMNGEKVEVKLTNGARTFIAPVEARTTFTTTGPRSPPRASRSVRRRRARSTT